MALSIFLARFLGIYMIIMFILLATRREEMTPGIKAFINDHALLLLAGSMTLLGGLAILIGHPVWGFEWPVVISLLGVLMVVKGIIRIGYPELCNEWGIALLGNKKWRSWMMIITLVIGIFLVANGFMR